MCEMSLSWIIVLIVLWSGASTVGNVTGDPGVATTTSNENSAFIISIKITNRIYNDSLEDHQSQNYKMLRQEVENVFFEMYSFTPSTQYQEIAEMSFSNGSVIASSTVLFGAKQKSGQSVKNIFVTNYQQHPSLVLDLNINYTADQEPIPVPLSLLQDIPHFLSSVTTSITTPNSLTTTELSDYIQSGGFTPSPTSALTISGLDQQLDNNNGTTATSQTHSTTHTSDFNHSASQTPSNISTNNSSITEHPSTVTSTMSASSLSIMTEHLSNISTMSASSSLNSTVHSSSNISTVSASTPSTPAVHLSSNISTISASTPSTPAVHPSSNNSSMRPSKSSTTTIHPSSNISTMAASSSSVIPGKTVTQKPTGPEGAHTVVTEQGVPGWGIAILVLAAIILFFMLVLLILLLLFWCCWWRQRGFMSVSDPDPTGYYNPDIPMYSTHSTYDSHNGKSLAKLSAANKQPLASLPSHLYRALFVPSQL